MKITTSTPVTWAFKENTEKQRNLCKTCIKDKTHTKCPKKNLSKENQDKLIAVKCIHYIKRKRPKLKKKRIYQSEN